MAPATDLLRLAELVNPGVSMIIIQTGAATNGILPRPEGTCPEALRLYVSESVVIASVGGQFSVVGYNPDRFCSRQIMHVVNAVRNALRFEREKMSPTEKAM